jgi:hypothetical protein
VAQPTFLIADERLLRRRWTCTTPSSAQARIDFFKRRFTGRYNR